MSKVVSLNEFKRKREAEKKQEAVDTLKALIKENARIERRRKYQMKLNAQRIATDVKNGTYERSS